MGVEKSWMGSPNSSVSSDAKIRLLSGDAGMGLNDRRCGEGCNNAGGGRPNDNRFLDLASEVEVDGEEEPREGANRHSTSCPASSRLSRGLGLMGAIRDGGYCEGGMFANVGVRVWIGSSRNVEEGPSPVESAST